MRKPLLAYIVITLIFGAGIYAALDLEKGTRRPACSRPQRPPLRNPPARPGAWSGIGLLDDAESWLICLLIILVATLGKLGGSMLAARLTGVGWPDAFALGALMNSRGLMELIALNVGYELGVLSPAIFTMMVLMALVTTFATGPLLSLSDRWRGFSLANRHGEGVVVEGDQRS